MLMFYALLSGTAAAAPADAQALAAALGVGLVADIEAPMTWGTSSLDTQFVALRSGAHTELVAVSLSHTCAAAAPGCYAGRPAILRVRHDVTASGSSATWQVRVRDTDWSWDYLGTFTETSSVAGSLGTVSRSFFGPTGLNLGSVTATMAYTPLTTGPRILGTTPWRDDGLAVPYGYEMSDWFDRDEDGYPVIEDDWTMIDCQAAWYAAALDLAALELEMQALIADLDQAGWLAPFLEAYFLYVLQQADLVEDGLEGWLEECNDVVGPLGSPGTPEIPDPPEEGAEYPCWECMRSGVEWYTVTEECEEDDPSPDCEDGTRTYTYEENVCLEWRHSTDSDGGICD